MTNAPRDRWKVTVHGSWQEAATLWRPFFASDSPRSPFQTEHWLSHWYAAFSARADVEPLLVLVTDASGADALALPLILHRDRLRTIEFADLGITDYNAPLLGPAAPVDETEARTLWRAVRAALPPADLIEFTKVVTKIGDRPNPLVQALSGEVSHLFGNVVQIDADYEAWLRSLSKDNRKELGRFWRVFTRDERARFVFADTPEAAKTLYGQLTAQQSARIRSLGLPYLLDEPNYDDFYRELLLDGLNDGSARLSALVAGDELVAALFGVARGDHYSMVRISTAGGEWANCSPGRLVIERTMEALHRQGFRTFDFTIGDYGHKRSFEVAHIPLVDIHESVSWRGWGTVGYEGAKAFVKRHPSIERFARKVLRRAA
ncbi:GNAT family N-acetyltransferase [Kaistia terrae]|uniref:GNAT family N-acetyltransferase n=1 Tax=Kaistia terrae TaxID=537017 RepID=A0ABW0PTC2_9HYPH|nr:GNAT family N-acetyltransferase [Kaistia terrae]MCX5577113.1 GNAT family N-acetyltransferase [Kaistia terrae]